MLIIPKKELDSDVDFYKGELTGNAWLNRAGELAAAKKRILEDPRLDPEEVVTKIKPLSRQLQQANKKLRQIPPVGGGGGIDEDEDPEDGSDLVSTGLEKWLKRVAKGMQTPKTPATGRGRGSLSTLGGPSTSAQGGRSTPRPKIPPKSAKVLEWSRKRRLQELTTPLKGRPSIEETLARSEKALEQSRKVLEKHKARKRILTSDEEDSDPGLVRSMLDGAFKGVTRGKGKRPVKPPSRYTPSSSGKQRGKGLYINNRRRPKYWIPFK